MVLFITKDHVCHKLQCSHASSNTWGQKYHPFFLALVVLNICFLSRFSLSKNLKGGAKICKLEADAKKFCNWFLFTVVNTQKVL